MLGVTLLVIVVIVAVAVVRELRKEFRDGSDERKD